MLIISTLGFAGVERHSKSPANFMAFVSVRFASARTAWRARILIILVAVIATAVTVLFGQERPLYIIPKPRHLVSFAGHFVLSKDVRIVAPHDRRTAEIVAFLRASIREQTGLTLLDRPRASNGTIRFEFNAQVGNDEGYRILISPENIKIEAKNTKGFFWAVQTFRQILPQELQNQFEIPALKIDDEPEYAYRGHMLDVGRHFFDLAFVKKQIDLMSSYKINTFRLHLTDDQGWRIEIKKFPKLTSVGAWRREPDGTRYGGFYTQRQIRELVEYARVRNVTIIPEIEMPGHATAAIAAYPEMSCRRKPIEVANAWGVHKDVFCAGNENTFEFLQGVLDEVFQLFPAPFIHIGGDEVPKDRWRECPRCQMRIRNEGLKDEHSLQAYFIKRIQRYVESKGRTLIGWDEILEGGADPNAVIEIWRGDAEGRKALENGNRVIVAGPFYFDAQPKGRTMLDVYQTELLAGSASSVHRPLILGAECPLWTEHVTAVNAESLLYPRLQAFAENLWTGGPREIDDFRRRLVMHYRLMDKWSVAYGPEDKNIAEYRIRYDEERKSWFLQAVPGMAEFVFHYTENGRDPSVRSRRFTNSVLIKQPGDVKVTPFRRNRAYSQPRLFRLAASRALGKPITYARPIHKNYNSAGDMALVDGVLGSLSYSDGIWAGWWGDDLDATIDLKGTRRLNSVTINFLQDSGSWIILPKAVTLQASNDAKVWTEIGTVDLDPDPELHSAFIRKVIFEHFGPVNARFVRVEAQNYGKLPPSHNGAGGKSWLFADEIIVE